MRQPGDIHIALVQAARDLYTPARAPTLMELAERSQVSYEAARAHVPKLKARGHLRQVRDRRVDYRNRPVAEYAPADLASVASGEGWVDLGQCMADWVR